MTNMLEIVELFTQQQVVASRSPHKTSNPDVGCVRNARTRFLFKRPQSQRRVDMCCPRVFRLPSDATRRHKPAPQTRTGDTTARFPPYQTAKGSLKPHRHQHPRLLAAQKHGSIIPPVCKPVPTD